MHCSRRLAYSRFNYSRGVLLRCIVIDATSDTLNRTYTVEAVMLIGVGDPWMTRCRGKSILATLSTGCCTLWDEFQTSTQQLASTT
eukprot:6210457-Pleurochrysis_carterae.AAC.6